MDTRQVGTSFILASLLLLGSCTGLQTTDKEGSIDSEAHPVGEAGDIRAEGDDVKAVSPAPVPSSQVKEYVKYGSGRFINKKAAARPQVRFIGGDITLNFEKTDIQEVAKVIIADLLEENYVIGPGVTGTVSLQTSRPIGREMLLPMLENLLRMNGAVLVHEGGMYRINAVADAARGTVTSSVGAPKGPGYHVTVVPLRYVSASEMQKILQPVLPEGGLLLADDKRNLLMLAGSSQEIQSWTSMIDIFDVDWMQGYSIGLFPLENTSAKVVAGELEKILVDGADGKLGKMVKLEPIERLNALLVITPQSRYLNQVKSWIERLDTVGSEPGRRLYVYQVKNRKAAELADVINEIFTFQSGQERSARPTLSPETPVVSVDKGKTEGKAGEKPAMTPSYRSTSVATVGREGLALPEGSNVRIVADTQNNAILVMASAAEYRSVEAALRKLDVIPLQVLVEASILEITLSDELSYGLEWYFQNQPVNDSYTGSALLDLNAGEGIGPIIPGFSYAVVNAAEDVNAVLNMLASDSKLNVLSSPSLMVLDNSQAKIRVGEQVPVLTSGERAIGDQTIYESYEYKDTGVMLSVTPRVNSGGLVTMEIDQTITDIGAVESTTQQRKFLERNITSEVAIQSGQTIILGGLILENNTDERSGVPFLRDIPILGWLFGATKTSNQRTELLVLITPKVVRSQQDASALTNEFKQRMRGLQPPPDMESKQRENPYGTTEVSVGE